MHYRPKAKFEMPCVPEISLVITTASKLQLRLQTADMTCLLKKWLCEDHASESQHAINN